MMMSDKCSFRSILPKLENEPADRPPLLADELYALKKKREQDTTHITR